MKNETPIYASMRRSPLTGTVGRSNDFNQIILCIFESDFVQCKLIYVDLTKVTLVSLL